LVQVVASYNVRVRKFVFHVVLLNKILDNGAGFPEDETGVWVLDGGVAAVGVDRGEGGFFERVEFDGVDCVRDGEFFEDQDDFPGIGAGCYGGWLGACVEGGKRGRTDDPDFDGLGHCDVFSAMRFTGS
jgi:hypothetical protein